MCWRPLQDRFFSRVATYPLCECPSPYPFPDESLLLHSQLSSHEIFEYASCPSLNDPCVPAILQNASQGWLVTDTGPPLHEASFGGYVDVARLLIKHSADAAAQSKEGMTTTLHRASE